MPTLARTNSTPIFIAVSLLSATALSYEILLMRLLSIVHWHHFAYMVISLALLGYGASGTFLALVRPYAAQRFSLLFITNAIAFAVSMLLCFVVGQRIPFNALEVIWNYKQQLYLILLYLLFAVPFFCVANCIGLSFIYKTGETANVYRADLTGAGAGALLIIAFLFVLPANRVLLVLVGLALLGSALAAKEQVFKLQRAVITILLVCAAGAYFIVPGSWISLHMSQYKGLSQMLQVMGTKVLSEHSSPLGLLTVVRSDKIPLRYAPGLSLMNKQEPPDQLAVFNDGDSMSVITHFDGNLESLGYLDQLTSALPYHLLQQPKVLILGAGGGADVLQALYHHSRMIDAVDINPQFINLVRDDYARFAGNIYQRKNVAIHIADARGFIAGSKKTYDLIQVALLDSFAASSAGVYALNESYLYTVEALEEYFSHLAPNGILAITRWLKLPPRDTLKLFATAIDALKSLGIASPAAHLVLIRSWKTTTLLLKKGLFTDKDIEAIRDFTDTRAFDPAYYPGMLRAEANRNNILREPFFYDGAKALLSPQRQEFIDRYKYDITPATDNKPYFFLFFKWDLFKELLSLRNQGGLPLVEWGYPILIATLLQATLFSVLFILAPLWIMRSRQKRTGRKFIGFYFFLLGLAFLFVEIAFIQKFTLFLFHPLYAIAVVISAFLFFAGLGSQSSDRFAKLCRDRSVSPVLTAVAGIGVVSLFYLVFLPLLFNWLMPLADWIKVIVSIVLIAPLAFFMGMPFPLGLSEVIKSFPEYMPWAWGVNGCASVISPIMATIMAIYFGFIFVVLLALLLYIIAGLLFVKQTDIR
jgi:spermidine synthase